MSFFALKRLRLKSIVKLFIIIWLRLVADITRALIGYERSLSGHYAAVMPTGRLRIMQIRKSSALTIYVH